MSIEENKNKIQFFWNSTSKIETGLIVRKESRYNWIFEKRVITIDWIGIEGPSPQIAWHRRAITTESMA